MLCFITKKWGKKKNDLLAEMNESVTQMSFSTTFVSVMRSHEKILTLVHFQIFSSVRFHSDSVLLKTGDADLFQLPCGSLQITIITL